MGGHASFPRKWNYNDDDDDTDLTKGGHETSLKRSGQKRLTEWMNAAPHCAEETEEVEKGERLAGEEKIFNSCVSSLLDALQRSFERKLWEA